MARTSEERITENAAKILERMRGQIREEGWSLDELARMLKIGTNQVFLGLIRLESTGKVYSFVEETKDDHGKSMKRKKYNPVNNVDPRDIPVAKVNG